MISKKFFLDYLVVSTLLILYFSTYQVSDYENAMRMRQSIFVRSTPSWVLIKKPGLHFKVPLLDHIILLDKRIQRIRLCSQSLIVEENDTIKVEYSISWRIKDPHRYIRFMSQNQMDTPAILSQWSNQFLQRNWIVSNFGKPMQNKFDSMKAYLEQKVQSMGIEILTCHMLQKIPTLRTRKNILQNMNITQADLVNKQRYASQLRVYSILNQAKSKQAALLAQAKRKVQNIQNESETLAMQIQINAYRQAPQFAAFYQDLQEKALLISQNPKQMSLNDKRLETIVTQFS